MLTRIALSLATLAGALGGPGVSSADVPAPTVTGPVGDAGIHGHALWDSWFELGDIGYTEAEYFVSGTARSLDGETADYTTRIIVTRPVDADDFNGTVLLEWVNVTAQFENAVDIISTHEMLHREGFAYVHVSAQAAGLCCTPLTPMVWDPVRYGELNHPGDDYSFDIFSQVAVAVRAPAGTDPTDGLDVRRVLAAGQSQSATMLDTYVRDVQPDAGVIDGFMIHGRGSKVFDPPPSVPVLHLLSDAEASPEEPNTDVNYRLWEVAGSSHSDFWIGYHQEFGQGPRFAGAPKMPASADEDMHEVAGNYGEQIHPLELTCILAGSLFPMRYAASAALHSLDRWVRTGDPPPSGPRFELDDAGALVRDEHGNARGGIRLPPIEVPVATYVSDACELGGFTVPFTDVQLQQLYPTHADYTCRMVAKTEVSVNEGFLLPPDAEDLLVRADAAQNRWLDAGYPDC